MSPEAVLIYAKENQICGSLRVVRAATPFMDANIVAPEPVYTIRKVGDDKPKTLKAKEGKGGRSI